MDALISVIVPVYKVEKYLDKCVESILAQTYKNLEIILVDDGSPDNSGKICDSWAEQDARIIVKHCENGGSGRARNIALRLAQGKYIAFVDSDDYISPFMLEYLSGCINASDTIDVAECGYMISDSSNVKFDKLETSDEIKIYTSEEAMGEHIRDHAFQQVIWNKLYRKSVLENIYFPEGKTIDDEFWTYQVIGKAKDLVHSNKRLYVYRLQDESVIHSTYSTKRLQALEAKRIRFDYIQEYYPSLADEALVNFWMSCLYQGQLSQKNLEDKEYMKAMNYIRECLKEMPSITSVLYKLPLDYKVWALLSKVSLAVTCRVRNVAKIGL